MGIWAERVLPPLMDFGLGSPKVTALRKEALADATGRVLEIGFGSGLNLRALPDGVRELSALDPSSGMRARADRRIAESGRTVRFELLSGESLPYADESFDTVLSTFTLCSIDPVEKALSEIRRVLAPGGIYLFLEHGIAPDPGVQRFQRLFNPVQWWMFGGCQLIKDVPALIESAGLRIERKKGLYFEEAPRYMGWFTMGLARR